MNTGYSRFTQLIPSILLVFSTIALGVVGYMWLENLSFLDAIYFTVITITSVGFGDLHPTTESSKIFTIILVLIGMFSLFYLISELISFFLESRIIDAVFLRRTKRSIRKMRNHIILCGYGNVGSLIADSLGVHNVVVIDKDEMKLGEARDRGFNTVYGDSINSETLKNANIDKAKAIIIALNSDPDAVYTILAAKELNRDLKVYARSNEKGSLNKMKRAGANYVICLPGVGSDAILKAMEGE